MKVIQRVMKSLTKRLGIQADLIANLSATPVKQVTWSTPVSRAS